MKGQYFWKTSFWLHKLVIRAHFKHRIQYLTCVTCQVRLINIALFNGINTNETALFCTCWFCLIPKLVFEVFIADPYVVLPS